VAKGMGVGVIILCRRINDCLTVNAAINALL